MRVFNILLRGTLVLTCEENRKEIGLLNKINLYPFPENDFDGEFQCVYQS